MSLQVNIGLLWDEQIVRGELICDFAVRCRVDCCRYITFDKTAGHFEAKAVPAVRADMWGIRLAESFSRAHAEIILAQAADAVAGAELELIEAGREWKTPGRHFDNRVWWPVVKLAARADAPALLEMLRASDQIDPLGFAVVRLDRAEAEQPFEFTLGDFSARVLEVWAAPLNDVARVWLYDVPIGRGFHWERKEQLEYRGELRLFQPGAGLSAVNRIDLETYLESAVGSEMRSDLPPAFSQAQAIAARSTVLATANRHHFADGFDLCNDDHCQCYQGAKREAGAVIAPVRATAGQILGSAISAPHSSALRVVDARYAKSCGGISDRYETAWGAEGPDYFAVRTCGDFLLSDLTVEENARRFLDDAPPAWCNPALHSYPTPWGEQPLFRWEFVNTRAELGHLIMRRTGKMLGAVRSLRAIRRGASGRILILNVEGATDSLTLYGELTIRRAFSESHLPSSFFVWDLRDDEIILRGGGWGHGVGLCQLGAAAMADAGWSVTRILEHYYPRSELTML